MRVECHSLQQHDAAQEGEKAVGVGVGVRVAELVDLDHTQHADDVHHGGVELQAVVGGAHMVADAEEALGHKGCPHGVEDAQLLQDAGLRSVFEKEKRLESWRRKSHT